MSQFNFSPHRRQVIDQEERERLHAAGALAVDSRRSRPRYFDGRFLAARDLTDDQQYLMSRQADLGRIAGWGVVSGLEVTPGKRATEVQLAPGLAITPSGESVVVTKSVTVDLLSLRHAELLDAHLGLRRKRDVWSRVSTGPHVLCARPVQYTAHPKRGYPTSVQGERQTEDHDIVEATAFTLVPWPTSHVGGAEEVRRQLVREIFVAQKGKGLKADLVPLAMVYLDGVSVRFVDMHLVRRSSGAEQDDLLGVDRTPREVSAAFVRQYGEHLLDVMTATGGGPIHAAEHFDALPPVGQLPIQVVHRTQFTEGFFPPMIDVDLSVIPEDELPLLVEESLSLPPIDLGNDEAALAGISVLVLLPLSRARFGELKSALADVRREAEPRSARFSSPSSRLLLRRPLPSAGLLRPALTLSAADRSEILRANAITAEESSAWTEALDEVVAQGEGRLWFVRRPAFDYRADLSATLVDIDVSGGVG